MRRHRTSFRATIFGLLVAVTCSLTGIGGAHSLAQEPLPDADQRAAELMAQMSVEEKIGQLFIVTFEGDNPDAESDIASLVANHKIGGVLILGANLNYKNDAALVSQVVSLNQKLQAWAAVELLPIAPAPALTETLTVTGTSNLTETAGITATIISQSAYLQVQPGLSTTVSISSTATVPVTSTEKSQLPTPDELEQRQNFVPLFVAVPHEGDNSPYTHVRSGLTALPSSMAIGATWQTQNAQTVGRIVGRELGALGLNLLLGPSLDVLDRPRLDWPSDLGTRCFGGDPYWVGVMGKAYIRGVHEGSEGKVATVVKHFPGLGGSDRPVNLEVATVRKSLEELQNVELIPFFAAAQGADDNEADTLAQAGVTDAMMTAHARYGAVRTTAKPVSFDAEAMHKLLSLPELQPWRQAGGVIVSDALGVPAVRKYSDPFLKTFNHRYIAREAFNAGNDILLLSQFAQDDSWDAHYQNIIDTIDFFREQYETDLSFQARVDESVRRILALKYRIYPEFSLASASPDLEHAQDVLGRGTAEIVRMARESATLLSPQSSDRLPAPPVPGEEIVTFVDDRQGKDCEDCEPFYLIEPSAVRQTLVKLYGPQASGRVDPERIYTYTFTDLKRFLTTPASYPELSERLESHLTSADWLLFAMLDVDTSRQPQSDALKALLALRDDALQGKKVIVLAYNAPYYLDTTEVSKLTAYYGIYAKLPAFIDVSINLIFQEFPPLGASPVTVEGINYNIFVQMEPDPNQIVEVRPVGLPDVVAEGTPQPLEVKKGDKLQLATSVILDRNGNPVPDGTPIEFRFFYPEEKLETRQVATTVRGIAFTEFVLDRAGSLEISVTGSQAKLRAEVPEDEMVEFQTVVPPTATPTATSTPTAVPTATATWTPTATPTATSTPTVTPSPSPTWTPVPVKRVTGRALSVAFLEVLGIGLAVLLIALGRGLDVGHAIRWGLLCIIGGLVGYNLYALGVPAALQVSRYSQQWGSLLTTTLGCVVAALLGVAWTFVNQRIGRAQDRE
jgi:beta-N-acetylhexosaminidase